MDPESYLDSSQLFTLSVVLGGLNRVVSILDVTVVHVDVDSDVVNANVDTDVHVVVYVH